MSKALLFASSLAAVLQAACTSGTKGESPDGASIDDSDASTIMVVDAGTDGAMTPLDGDTHFDAAFDSAVPPCVVNAGPPKSRQTEKPLGSTTAPNGFLEYLPACYTNTTPTPLMIYLHGSGANGNGTTELNMVTGNGPPHHIANNTWDNARPFIVLSPQHSSGCPSSAEVDAFITWAKSNYTVDPKRIYLTGLSCGAIGAWDYLGDFKASTIAAAVLLSGSPGNPNAASSTWGRTGCMLGEVAIWSFHGDLDPVVAYAPDQATMNDLIACPSPPRRSAIFTDVVGGVHNIWDPIYSLSGGYGDIYAWMLNNAKP